MSDDKEDEKPAEQEASSIGPFFMEGMQVAFGGSGFVLRFHDDGNVTMDSLTFHAHWDVCPTWLKIAWTHLGDAEERNRQVVELWPGPDNQAKAAALERELESCMQAMTAAAVAIDALYGAVRERVKIDPSVAQAWRDNKTARAARIAETLRQAFKLPQQRAQVLQAVLADIFRPRDMAVHPKGNLEAFKVRSDIQAGVEWRFNYFRFDNAKLVVGWALSIAIQLDRQGGRSENDSLRSYCVAGASRISPIVELWDARYGQLIEEQ